MSVKMVSGICGIPPVSVNEAVNASAISIYPNPAYEQVTVQGLLAGCEVTLTDITGRVVVAYTAQAEKAVLPTVSLHSGLYVLSFIQANGSVAHRQVSIVH